MARICCGFGMTVLACDQYRNPALDGLVRYVGLEELLRTADLVSLHCPLTAETYHMINAETIQMMRDSAVLVNTSRGGLIDTRRSSMRCAAANLPVWGWMSMRTRTVRCLKTSPTMCCAMRSCRC